jgi:tetratricopeptide (TPR) repeat protein
MNDDLNPEGLQSGPNNPPENRMAEPLAGALADLLDRQAHPLAGGTILPDAAGPCPEPGVWLRFATGECDPSTPGAPTNQALIAHAAGCSSCAQRLRQSIWLLSPELLPEEEPELSGQPAVSDAWQRNLAGQLAATPTAFARRKSARRYLWSGAALAASLCIAVGIGAWWQHVNTPERLLAEAYGHSRAFDLRMPGAGFAEVTPQPHLRGTGGGHESSRLLDARSRIERQLENAPSDPHWLQLEARADVIDEKFDPAVDILDRLIAAGPETASLLADDAAAYFQRGAATGSENDRATALDYLRRADALSPDDPVILFNEAVAMEDRGQLMNAVETWNRYLKFERDPRWLAEGRRRLDALELRLDRLRTHQSRVEQHLAAPQAMRALAADGAALASLDEELASIQLPKLIASAFPMPVDRSRGSPCDENCQAARTLLRALAASLIANHQDPWLAQLLPADFNSATDKYLEAVHALGQGIGSDAAGDYAAGKQSSARAAQLFIKLSNQAGTDRATVEQVYATQVLSDIAGGYRLAHSILGHNPQFAWIQIQDLTEDAALDPAPDTGIEDNPRFLEAIRQAQQHHYTLLELRARNWLGAAAVDTGDVETAWRVYLGTVRKFYAGDFAAARLYSTLSGLEEIEESTPRVQHALLLQRETLGVLGLSQNRGLIPAERLHLAAVAIRAGADSLATEQMRLAQQDIAARGGDSIRAFLFEDEQAMATLYLDRGDPASAAKILDAAYQDQKNENNSFHRRDYALLRGRLELARGNFGEAELLLSHALLEEEREGRGGAKNISFARQDRGLYAALAGIWLAQGRPPEDVLALWERYRLRILGIPAQACADKGLACLKPQLMGAIAGLGTDRVMGQIVLFDRVLLYQVTRKGVEFSSQPVGKEKLLAATAPLERAVSSPSTSQATIHQAASRVGDMLLTPLRNAPALDGGLLIESDPLLGNLPWPAVETAAGPLGLGFDLAETPSLLLEPQLRSQPGAASRGRRTASGAGNSLIVGASVASGLGAPLPEVLEEAKAVARFGRNPNLLLAAQATQAQVGARLETASTIHFAGHAAQQDGATRLLLAPGKDRPGSAGDQPYLTSAIFRSHPPRAARLAVFSACATGKREQEWNHGMEDIVDTLAALGVPQIVATRWQIDSASAVPMMDAFYAGLATGKSVPRALTAARQSLVHDQRYRHPYYWAAYYASSSGSANLSQDFQPAR